MTDLLTFVAALNARGIELQNRGAVLGTWPRRAWREGLTDEERAFIREHRAEFRELVRAGLPETTVEWKPGIPETSAADARDNVAPPLPTAPAPFVCPDCLRAPCIGVNHWAFAFLHPDAPSVVAQRNADYTRQMTESQRREWILR